MGLVEDNRVVQEMVDMGVSKFGYDFLAAMGMVGWQYFETRHGRVYVLAKLISEFISADVGEWLEEEERYISGVLKCDNCGAPMRDE